MSTKQVTITVTQSVHQVDKNGKVKKSLTTYEVMKPVETLKQVATQNTWDRKKSGEKPEVLCWRNLCVLTDTQEHVQIVNKDQVKLVSFMYCILLYFSVVKRFTFKSILY